MADENKESTQEAPKSSGSGLKIVIILLILILLLGGGGVAAYLFIFKKHARVESPAAGSVEQPAVQDKTAKDIASSLGPVLSYDPFIVNLADPGGRKYLKATISLELSNDPKFLPEVESKQAKIRDIIIGILTSKTYDDVSSVQGKIALKQEIMRRLNTIMVGGQINDVYITEFVVQ